MKKILLLGNLAWVVVIMLTNCNNASSSNDVSSYDCRKEYFSGMPADKFLEGIARYKNYQWSASNDRITAELKTGQPFKDARACWYSLAQLKKFICLIEKEKPDSVGEMGIRFYYATYPELEKHTVLVKAGNHLSPVEAEVGLHHTLFMVPTYGDKEGNIDFYSTVLPGFENRPAKKVNQNSLTNPDWNAFMKEKVSLLILGGMYSTPSSENQGMLCPPTCPPHVTTTLDRADAGAKN